LFVLLLSTNKLFTIYFFFVDSRKDNDEKNMFTYFIVFPDSEKDGNKKPMKTPVSMVKFVMPAKPKFYKMNFGNRAKVQTYKFGVTAIWFEKPNNPKMESFLNPFKDRLKNDSGYADVLGISSVSRRRDKYSNRNAYIRNGITSFPFQQFIIYESKYIENGKNYRKDKVNLIINVSTEILFSLMLLINSFFYFIHRQF